MSNSAIAIFISSALFVVVLIWARWFDRKYYIPLLNETFGKYRKQPVYEPNLIGIGLLAAGGGLALWTLIAVVWIWVFHK